MLGRCVIHSRSERVTNLPPALRHTGEVVPGGEVYTPGKIDQCWWYSHQNLSKPMTSDVKLRYFLGIRSQLASMVNKSPHGQNSSIMMALEMPSNSDTHANSDALHVFVVLMRMPVIKIDQT